MQLLPDDLDLTPYEERLRQCLGNAAVAIRGFYQPDVTALIDEVKRLRQQREEWLHGVKSEPIELTPDPVAEITKPAPTKEHSPLRSVVPMTDNAVSASEIPNTAKKTGGKSRLRAAGGPPGR